MWGYRRAPIQFYVVQVYEFPWKWHTELIQTGAETVGARRFTSRMYAVEYGKHHATGVWRVRAIR